MRLGRESSKPLRRSFLVCGTTSKMGILVNFNRSHPSIDHEFNHLLSHLWYFHLTLMRLIIKFRIFEKVLCIRKLRNANISRLLITNDCFIVCWLILFRHFHWYALIITNWDIFDHFLWVYTFRRLFHNFTIWNAWSWTQLIFKFW